MANAIFSLREGQRKEKADFHMHVRGISALRERGSPMEEIEGESLWDFLAPWACLGAGVKAWGQSCRWLVLFPYD
jgi:hypothetical protein